MKLTRASSYALHAVVYLAQQKFEKPMASDKIAKAQGIPGRFLLKVLKPLVSHNLLKSVKGPNGGYQLARSADEISVLEVIEAADGGKIRGQSPFSEKNTPTLSTKLEEICSESAEAIRATLDKYYVSDLVTAKKEAGPVEEKPARKKARTV